MSAIDSKEMAFGRPEWSWVSQSLHEHLQRTDHARSVAYRLESCEEGADLLSTSGIPFLVGGAYAFEQHTGIDRRSCDFDVFVLRKDARNVLDLCGSPVRRKRMSRFDELEADRNDARLYQGTLLSRLQYLPDLSLG